jgi:hypothetical protein
MAPSNISWSSTPRYLVLVSLDSTLNFMMTLYKSKGGGYYQQLGSFWINRFDQSMDGQSK